MSTAPVSADSPISIALETAGHAGHVALGIGGRFIASRPVPRIRRHNLELVPTLDALLGDHGLKAARLDELYVSLGPGSFTGLRMAIAAAQMLALAQPTLRLVGVPTLDVLAAQHQGAAEHVAVMLNIKRGTSYCACYRHGAPVLEPAIRPADVLFAQAPRPLAVVAEVDPGLPATGREEAGLHWLGPEAAAPDPEAAWQLGRHLAGQGRFVDSPALLPLYIREPEAVTLWEQRGLA